MNPLRHLPVAGFAACAVLLSCFTASPSHADTTYVVRQTFTVKDLPADAKKVRGWFCHVDPSAIVLLPHRPYGSAKLSRAKSCQRR